MSEKRSTATAKPIPTVHRRGALDAAQDHAQACAIFASYIESWIENQTPGDSDRITWSDVGNLAHVREKLNEIRRLIGAGCVGCGSEIPESDSAEWCEECEG